MYSDKIISEVWRNREAYAKQHNNDLDLIIADLIKRQQTPHSVIVDRRNKNENIQQMDSTVE